MNREFLNHFWDLASDDDDTRLKASDGIITYLKSSENAATDMDYVCKRLVRGLSSSRNHARTGFSTCLTELVAAEFISIDIIISLINETTKVSFVHKLFRCDNTVIYKPILKRSPDL